MQSGNKRKLEARDSGSGKKRLCSDVRQPASDGGSREQQLKNTGSNGTGTKTRDVVRYLEQLDKTVKRTETAASAPDTAVSQSASGSRGGAGSDKRTPLTDRQKHKLWKLKQKRKMKSKGQKLSNQPVEKAEKHKDSSDNSKVSYTKIDRPHSPAQVSSNWKQLQLVLQQDKVKTSTDVNTESSGKKKVNYKNIRKKYKEEKEKASSNAGGTTTDRNSRKKDKGEKEQQASTSEKSSNSAPADIWFDDVDEIYLDQAAKPKPSETLSAKVDPLVRPDSYKGLTKTVAMDCEMVGVGDGTDNMLARVSIVNQYGEKVYDKFVKPMEKVVDYRTHVSGVRKEDIAHGDDFFVVQKEVAAILKGRILVGHAIDNDMKVLYLKHPKKRIRDTSSYKPFRQLFKGRTPSLKKLTAQVLSVGVQEGEHNSVQDAQAAMRLYTRYKQQWEKELKSKFHKKSQKMKS